MMSCHSTLLRPRLRREGSAYALDCAPKPSSRFQEFFPILVPKVAVAPIAIVRLRLLGVLRTTAGPSLSIAPVRLNRSNHGRPRGGDGNAEETTSENVVGLDRVSLQLVAEVIGDPPWSD